ncbi:hypothetical protein JTB14_000879 [Gonioctena quinquepunctata]|nr:hypothetical protein JTB14_000879 [Gonioctena quinquepunctata]
MACRTVTVEMAIRAVEMAIRAVGMAIRAAVEVVAAEEYPVVMSSKQHQQQQLGLGQQGAQGTQQGTYTHGTQQGVQQGVGQQGTLQQAGGQQGEQQGDGQQDMFGFDYVIASSVNMKGINRVLRSEGNKQKHSLSVFLLPATSTSASRQEYENANTGKEAEQKFTDNRNLKNGKKRARKRKQHFDETTENEIYLTGKNAFIVNIHNIVCDGLIMELGNRSDVYENIVDDFRILFYLNISENAINLRSEKSIRKYSRAIDIIQFEGEVLQFLKFLEEVNMTDPAGICNLLIEGLQSTSPKVELFFYYVHM